MVYSKRSLLLTFLFVVTPTLSLAADIDMLVSSRDTSSVKRYDGVTGAYLGDFITPGAGGLSQTLDIAYGPDQNLYVAGLNNTALLKYDGQTGAFLGAATHGRALDKPTKFEFGPDGLIYISQWSNFSPHSVLRFDALTGAFVDDFTGFVPQPMEQEWDVNGNMYVTSIGSSNVQKFDVNGNNLGSFTPAGSLSVPVSVRWGADNNLYVADWQLGRERIFHGTTGAFLGDFAGGLVNTEGSIVGPDGFLYMTDWTLNRIHQYNATTGAFIKVFADQGGMVRPNDIAFTQQPVPEPSILAGLGAGLVALVRRKRKKTK